MQSFFNDDKNRDVIKVIGSFLDFVSLGNFLKSSKVINHSCKLSLPQGEPDPYEISKAPKASKYLMSSIRVYDTRVINASCFYRPIEITIYHNDHFINMKEHYFVIGGKKQGYYKCYWDHGGIKQECFYKDDLRNGSHKWYWRNGKLMEERFYKDDHESGSYKSYYENGNIEEEGFYKDGEIDGLYKSYYENGNIKEKCFYKYGEKDGLYKKHYHDGTIKAKYFYENGTIKAKYFYENGECISLNENSIIF